MNTALQSSAQDGAIAFAEKLLSLLDQARFTSTYKYAVLLALIDLCLEGVTHTGGAPSSVTTQQLAEKVLELYWPHTAPFRDGNHVLEQNRRGQAEILTLIRSFRDKHARDPSEALSRARHAAPAPYDRLLRDIEWKLVELPLPRLQKFGVTDDRFIFQIGWDAEIKRSEFLDSKLFPNVIRFVASASDHLLRLAGLLRPLVQRRWASEVARLNKEVLKDGPLEDFLFGSERIALSPVTDGLRELQDNRCFYCDARLRQPQVDHFIPWARVPLNAIENLVLADATCNNQKSDHLAAVDHVETWSVRLLDKQGDLTQIADLANWEHAPDRARGVARAVYFTLGDSARLWRAPTGFVHADPAGLRVALGVR